MNIINKALEEIKFRIPTPVITEAFKEPTVNHRAAPFNLDEAIMNKVIKARVMIDANLVAGEAVNINLDHIEPIFRDQFCVVYEVPPSLTHGREILSVLSLSYMPYSNNVGAFGMGQTSIGPLFNMDTPTVFQQLAESYSSIPHVSSASAELVGYNTIRITDPMRSVVGYILRCYLTNENHLNNINPRSYVYFSQLVALCVKSYIYNKLIIRIDEAYLQGGQTLGAFKTIVESYADSEEMYQTYLRETWAAVAHMNNTVQHERFLTAQIPIGL